MGAANILTKGGEKWGLTQAREMKESKNRVCSRAGKMELGVGDDIGKLLVPVRDTNRF